MRIVKEASRLLARGQREAEAEEEEAAAAAAALEQVLDLVASVQANLSALTRPNNGRAVDVVVCPLDGALLRWRTLLDENGNYAEEGRAAEDHDESSDLVAAALAPVHASAISNPSAEEGTTTATQAAIIARSSKQTVSVRALDYVDAEIGYKLWDSGNVFARLLLSPLGTALLAGRRVVELGSGLGLCGVIAARIAQHTTLTDYKDSLVRNLDECLARNQVPSAAAQAIALDWRLFRGDRGGEAADFIPADVRELHHAADVVIGSDLVFEEAALHLPHVIRYLLKPSGSLFLSINAASHVALVPTFNATFRAAFPRSSHVVTVPSSWYDPDVARSTAEPHHLLHVASL